MSKKKVLLIEDYAPWWGSINEVLEAYREQFEFIEYDGVVKSVEQGMELIDEHQPDVVVLDHSLSGGDADYNREGGYIANSIVGREIEIISFSSHRRSKIERYYPEKVVHFARKSEKSVLECLLNRCDCVK